MVRQRQLDSIVTNGLVHTAAAVATVPQVKGVLTLFCVAAAMATFMFML